MTQNIEIVFSVMDFIVTGLLMIATFLWFRSKHVAKFYEACKVGIIGLIFYNVSVIINVLTQETNGYVSPSVN